MLRIAPCKDCPDRTTGERTEDCHATCERYAEYVASREAVRKQRILYSQVQSAIVAGHRRLKDNPPTGGNKRH